MSNPIVRGEGGELSPIRTQMESPRWLHWDPLRQMSPFWTRGEQPARFPARFTPDFVIRETKDSFVFQADVPGIEDKDLQITMTGNRLTISGRRDAEEPETADIYYARECSYGGFTRVFTLPDRMDGDRPIRADLNQGVLTLVLPKRPEPQPKHIEVRVTDTRRS
jgi:HSP20 family protein